MRVGVCAVGAELLAGSVVDTNTSWLAQRLLESGCTVSAAVVIGDNRERMVDALAWLADRAEVLVVGGGLGPTADDVTRDAVADFAGVRLERRQELVDHLDAVYERLERAMPPDTLHQADLPEGAVIHPPRGTAAGFVLDVPREDRTVRIHVLPGVPWEYRGTAEDHVLPDLVSRNGGRASVTRTLHVAGLGESGVGEALQPLSAALEAERAAAAEPDLVPELGFLATTEEVLVKITALGTSPQDARTRSNPLVEQAAELLGSAVSSIDELRLEDEVARLLRVQGRTVATAEAFTAGRLAARLSSIPGSERYLAGGTIAYSPAVAEEFLGERRDLVSTHGLQSPEVVAAMAQAAVQRFDVDLAVATTGVTDARDEHDDRVGEAAWAIADRDGNVVVDQRYIPAGDRDIIQNRGAAFALEALRRHLLEDPTAARVTP